eukprot:scaffold1149_cov380-Prasinococcus_capsulatus_cf.AAC.2
MPSLGRAEPGTAAAAGCSTPSTGAASGARQREGACVPALRGCDRLLDACSSGQQGTASLRVRCGSPSRLNPVRDATCKHVVDMNGRASSFSVTEYVCVYPLQERWPRPRTQATGATCASRGCRRPAPSSPSSCSPRPSQGAQAPRQQSAANQLRVGVQASPRKAQGRAVTGLLAFA